MGSVLFVLFMWRVGMPDLTLESSNQNSLNDPLNDLLVEGINNNVHNNKEREKIILSYKHRAIFTRGIRMDKR